MFILVYSIDNQESFEQVKRLQEQVWECKGQSKSDKQSGIRSHSKKKPDVPMIIVGNKCDKEKSRVIGMDELQSLTEGVNCCDYVEASAKKNINIEEIFMKLFVQANLPQEMSPSLHRRVQPNYVGQAKSKDNAQGSSFRRTMTIRRRMSDACGAVAPNARRPSIRTDLLILQTKRSVSQDDERGTRRDSKNCSIQ